MGALMVFKLLIGLLLTICVTMSFIFDLSANSVSADSTLFKKFTFLFLPISQLIKALLPYFHYLLIGSLKKTRQNRCLSAAFVS
jgi:hypothetical protein